MNYKLKPIKAKLRLKVKEITRYYIVERIENKGRSLPLTMWIEWIGGGLMRMLAQCAR
jgi:hypothetical protein